MTTPALMRLRQAHPESEITILTPDKLAGLWQGQPWLDRVIAFPARQSPLTIARQLRLCHFQTALLFPNSQRAALEAWLARIPERIGHRRAGWNWMLTTAVEPRPEFVPMKKRSPREIRRLIRGGEKPRHVKISDAAHQVYEYLHLAAVLGANPEPLPPQIVLADSEVAATAAKFGLSRPPSFWCSLCPGAEYGPAKRWGADRFAAVAESLHQKTGCGWIVLGSAGDQGATARVTQQIKTSGPVIDLAGRTTVRELAGLLKACRLVISNDTGPAHLAAAVGTRLLVVFGSTSPERTAPRGPGSSWIIQSQAPCSPCFLRECPIDFRCMNEISVPQVALAALEMLEKASY